MKKIQTLFQRVFENHKIVGIAPELTSPEFQAVMDGKTIATVKIDGSCCAIINGKLYRRYDGKRGKKPPVGAIPCCGPDPLTGHWPFWVKCERENPNDRWFFAALDSSEYAEEMAELQYATFEAVGKHFNANPYNLENDVLVRHGDRVIDELTGRPITFDEIASWLYEHNEEGIVFWHDSKPLCKIKRTDFGLDWPAKEQEEQKIADL